MAAYRLPYLLAGDALVLKQESQFYEHFYKDLKPFEHYIPFKRDLSDLMEKIQWAKDNDAQVLDFTLITCWVFHKLLFSIHTRAVSLCCILEQDT